MASTRRASVDVFQDWDDASAHHSGHADVETALLNALAPLSDASRLNPTTTAAPGSSPRKTDSSPLRPISSHSLTDVKIPPPLQPSFATDSPQKNASFYSAYSASMSQLPEMAQFHECAMPPALDKENYYGSSEFSTLTFGHQYYDRKGSNKRMIDCAPIQHVMNKKPKLEMEEPFMLPDPKDMPAVHDDGQKPNISYAELIGMAILRSPSRKLTLAQIYKWISDNFTFYKASESGWQNSIRHNLSLNKNFIKQERPKDDPGKGNYWAIKPGEERPFLLGKKNPIRRITNPDGSTYINGMPSDAGYRNGGAPAIGNFTLAPGPVRKSEPKVIDSAKFPDDTDLSSDGTIPASDPALHDDEKEDLMSLMPPPANVPSPTHMPSSPPPADLADLGEIGSSPPAMPMEERKATPPPVPRFPSTSRSGHRRQKFAGLNDSGYWSSIESSAARGAAHILTSEADIARRRTKKGRAEAEIARIRSSSFGSPGGDGVDFRIPPSQFASSSPLRDENPLTPAVIFKKPVRPPPSVSPNTNLRNHRNRMRALLGTPAKVMEDAPELEFASSFTPAKSPQPKTPWDLSHGFKDERDTWTNGSFRHSDFHIHIDLPEEDIAARGSPEKRTARRPSLARAATSTGILADITGSSRNNNVTLAPPPSNSPFSFSPFLAKQGSLRSPAKLGSPLKQSHKPPSVDNAPSHPWNDIGLGDENIHPGHQDTTDLFCGNLPSDGSEEGIDLAQDFGKIGQAAFHPTDNRANGSPVKRSMLPPARPSLNRASTSRW